MMHKRRLLFLFIFVITGLSQLGFSWSKLRHAAQAQDIVKVKTGVNSQGIVYTVEQQKVNRSLNKGEDFQTIFSAAVGMSVRDFFVSVATPKRLFVALDRGAWMSVNDGQDWQKIYDSSDELSQQVNAIAEIGDEVYLGTGKGVFSKRHDESLWNEIEIPRADKSIRQITEINGEVYWATSTAVYHYMPQQKKVSEIFSVPQKNVEQGEVVEFSEDTDALKLTGIVSFGQLAHDQAGFYVASTQGIYLGGVNHQWRSLTSAGLPVEVMTDVVVLPAPDPMFVASTKRGAFIFKDGRWQALYQGLDAVNIADLEIDSSGNIYAATTQGLYSYPLSLLISTNSDPGQFSQASLQEGDVQAILERLSREPNISKVQSLAIHYAEVHPEKIQQWRALARKRAWLPSLDIGFDGGADWSRNDSIFGSSSSGGAHYIAPDDKSSGGDSGWDVALSWDLSELVWNSDQTSIDSRSKLMVELRDDILNQITRIYFERRRMQIELATMDHPNWQMRVEYELRIAELTALIDGLTGGQFSQSLNASSGMEPIRKIKGEKNEYTSNRN
jgi:hypothetical protein